MTTITGNPRTPPDSSASPCLHKSHLTEYVGNTFIPDKFTDRYLQTDLPESALKIIPLINSASHPGKLINLFLCFNALRDNGKTKCFGE